jgi:hypothetical protein
VKCGWDLTVTATRHLLKKQCLPTSLKNSTTVSPQVLLRYQLQVMDGYVAIQVRLVIVIIARNRTISTTFVRVPARNGPPQPSIQYAGRKPSPRDDTK